MKNKSAGLIHIVVIVIVAIVGLLIILVAVVSIYNNYTSPKQVQQRYFDTIGEVSGLTVDQRFVSGNITNQDSLTTEISNEEPMTISEFESLLDSALLNEFEVVDMSPLESAQMVSVDPSNRRFCSISSRNVYPGVYPYDTDFNIRDTCPELQSYYMLSASWLYEDSGSAPKECETLEAVIVSTHTRFSDDIHFQDIYTVSLSCNKSLTKYDVLNNTSYLKALWCINYNICRDGF